MHGHKEDRGHRWLAHAGHRARGALPPVSIDIELRRYGQVPSGDEPSKAEREYQREHLARAEPETPPQVVDKVMRALRRPNEPYPLHGCEVAIRYCSPSNAASRLSPQGFASYLREPW